MIQQEPKYEVCILYRDGGGQAPPDYHATVNRIEDAKEIVVIAAWLWVLKLKTSRHMLDREYRLLDKLERKNAKRHHYYR